MSDNYKKETYNTLQSMGYSYVLVDTAYKQSTDKSTEGVINYIYSNPNLMDDLEQDYNNNNSRPNTGYSQSGDYGGGKRSGLSNADLEIKAQLLLMGYEEYLIDACIENGINRSVDQAINWLSDNSHKIKIPSKKIESKEVSNTSQKNVGIAQDPNDKKVTTGLMGGRTSGTTITRAPAKTSGTVITQSNTGMSRQQPGPVATRRLPAPVKETEWRAPLANSNKTPVQQPVQKPSAQSTQQSFRQPTQQPVQQQARQPTQQIPQQQLRQPTQQPVQQQVRQPAQQPVQKQVRQPEKQYVQQPQVERLNPATQPTPDNRGAQRTEVKNPFQQSAQIVAPTTETTANFTKTRYEHYQPKQILIRDDNIKVENKKSEDQLQKEQAIENERQRKEILVRAQARERENEQIAQIEFKKRIKEGIKEAPKQVEISVPQIEPVESLVPPPGLSKGEKDKWIKEQEKKQLLKQIAVDRALKSGKPVKLEDDNKSEDTVEHKFKELFEKMEKCYPMRTPSASILAKCLDTIRIYLSNFLLIQAIFLFFIRL